MLASVVPRFFTRQHRLRSSGGRWMWKKDSTSLLRLTLRTADSLQRRNLRSRYRNVATSGIYQQESLHDQRKSLTQAIEELRSAQRVYIPGCSEYLDNIDPTSVIDAPESTKLWLPSALPSTSRDTWCIAGTVLIEFRLRYAMAVDSLDHIRRLCRLVQGLHLQKLKHPVPTQGTATRSRGVFEGLHVRIAQISARYRDSRTALLRLHPTGGWLPLLQDLANADARGPGPADDASKSQFIPTWIWRVKRAPPTPPDLPGFFPSSPPQSRVDQPPAPSSITTPIADEDCELSERELEDSMLVDWARARERAKRFEEEIELSVEEMRRTLLYFSWKASEWERLADERANSDKPPPAATLQGLRAYAYRHAAMYRSMVKVFVSDWHSCLQPRGLGTDWLSGYSDLLVPRNGWNRIPSIIPPISEQPEVEVDSAMLSDQDDALEPPAAVPTEGDEALESHNDFVQIMADGGSLGESSAYI